MGRKIAGDADEDVPALIGVAPFGELPDSRLQHLIGVESCIFAQHRMCERGDQRLWRMAEREMPCHEPCREIDLSLPVEGVQQGGADHLRLSGKVVQLFVAVTRHTGRRHIEIASKVERHSSVDYGANRRDLTVGVDGPDPLEHLVDRVGVGEDVVRGLPVGVFVGIAEARHPERCAVSERSTKISRGGACADRFLKRINDPGRVVPEQRLGECRVVGPAMHAAASQ